MKRLTGNGMALALIAAAVIVAVLIGVLWALHPHDSQPAILGQLAAAFGLGGAAVIRTDSGGNIP